MKIKHIFIAFFATTLLLSSCNQSDDLTTIFLGKTWKLTNIFWDDGSSQRICTDYWTGENAEEARDESYKFLEERNGKLILRFDGLESENEISGVFTGQATGASIEANWNANGKSHAFSTSGLSTGNEKDPLGIAFIKGLQSAYKYSGDAGSGLQIFFKDEMGRKRYMLLRVERE